MMILLCLSAILAFTSAGRLSANYNSEPSRTYIPANVQVDPYPQQSVASAALIRPSAVFAQPSQTYLPANRNFVAPAKLVAPAIQTPVVSAGYTGIGYGGVHVRGVGEVEEFDNNNRYRGFEFGEYTAPSNTVNIGYTGYASNAANTAYGGY